MAAAAAGAAPTRCSLGRATITFRSSSGAKTIDGGSGIDWLHYHRSDLTDAVQVNLTADGIGEPASFNLADGTTVEGVELLNLTTGSGDDFVAYGNTTIKGTQGWAASAGNDTAIIDYSAFSSDVQAFSSGALSFVRTQPFQSGLFITSWHYEVVLGDVENLTLFSGSGNNSLQGLNGNNVLFGNDGNDALFGHSGNDFLDGGAGNDNLSDGGGSSSGTDTMLAGAGNDHISVAGSSTKTIDGGSGIDWLHYHRSDLTDAVQVNLTADGIGEPASFNLADGTTVEGVELLNLTTGSGDDLVTFNNTTIKSQQGWDANDGNDTAIVDYSAFISDVFTAFSSPNYIIHTQSFQSGLFITSWHYEVVLGDVENLTLFTGSGNDHLQSLSGNNVLFGNDGDDNLFGSGGDDFLDGGEGNDNLSDGVSSGANSGIDTMLAGAGNDHVSVLGIGKKTIDGGSGIDWLHYHRSDLTEAVISLIADGNGEPASFNLADGTTVEGIELLESDYWFRRRPSHIQQHDDQVITVLGRQRRQRHSDC